MSVAELGRVAVVVLTYQRVGDVTELLVELMAQIDRSGHEDVHVLVVDNDPEASARTPVADLGLGRVRYVHEPAPGIAHARNRALDEVAGAHLLIFIDDDERPVATWLTALLDAYCSSGAVGVVGPVVPDYELPPDPWIEAGKFFVRKQFRDGTEMPAAGTGNLLLDLRQVATLGAPRFDERFGLTGGSDTLFTRALIRNGGKIVWAEDAGVLDKVPAQRLNRDWVLKRAFRSGNTWSRTGVELAPVGPDRALARLKLTGKGLPRIVAGGARVALGTVSRSPRHQARGSRTVARGLGMVTGAWGVTYTEYRRTVAAPGRRRSLGQSARPVYRVLRKRLKRTWSHVLLNAMRIRNRTSSQSVLGTAEVLVSLTTYGTRIHQVAYAIESIAAGVVRPRRLVLWLDEAEPLTRLPRSLKRLERRGLEIRRTRNYRSHKKYYPSLDLAGAKDLPLVTADDDILYPVWWLQRLHEAGLHEPGTILCHRASIVTASAGSVDPYSTWPRCRDTDASLAHFATSGAGALFPPAMLRALADHGTAFMELSPTADDVWLHWVALQARIPTRQVSRTPRLPPFIPGSQGVSLEEVNLSQGGNDSAIARLYSEDDVRAVQGLSR